MPEVIVFLLILAGLVLYFIPFIAARQRKHRSTTGIFLLNLFLGWSLVGWVIALVWAVSDPKPIVVVTDNQPTAGDTKKCPFCDETIKQAAKKCRYCQSDLPETA